MLSRNKIIYGRPLVDGFGEGLTLVSKEPISFYGGVDPITGKVIEKKHPLYGKTIAGKILIFPYGKGSTVGSYILLRLKKRGLAPAGIINVESEPIIIVGCIISEIPLMDKPEIDVSEIPSGKKAKIYVRYNEKAYMVLQDE